MSAGHAVPFSRRNALLSLASAATGVVALRGEELPSYLGTQSHAADVAFCFVTDTHYLANKEQPEVMDPTSARICRRLVDTLNRLGGQSIPVAAGAGTVAKISGIIHGGDIVDSADKRGGIYPRMQATEFASFEADYGLNGKDGVLEYPVFEVYGNHDGPQGDTLVVDGIKRRNQSRKGVANVSPNGLHYSWDWGRLHLINLGIVVGQTGSGLQRRRYNPMNSLKFLKQDLMQMDDPTRPVVVTQHVDLARYSVRYTKDEERFLHM